MKTIVIDIFNPASITKAMKELEAFRANLKTKTAEFVKQLGDRGVQIADVKFGEAQYDGTNDVTVHIEERGENSVAVVAVGNATLFIEFGTGIIYPDIHPEAHQLGMNRGEYGYGFGNNIWGWTYEGNPGTNGVVISQGMKAGKVHTFGNPANMCMYYTIQELENIFEETARRVFNG